MFSRTNKSSADSIASGKSSRSTPPSLISEGVRIVGNLNSDGEVQVDGLVEGDIRAKDLLIGPTADIRGTVIADSVTIHGKISGEIEAQSVRLSATAHVAGNILHRDIAIEAGAFLEGHCKRMQEEKMPQDIKQVLTPQPASKAQKPEAAKAHKAQG
jgi:cytoskeletal protein CcmA (bactofilin family)